MRWMCVVAVVALSASQIAAQSLDRTIAEMPMKEFGALSLFVRADVLRPLKPTSNRLEFDACMIAAASDPRTWRMTVQQAVHACTAHARTAR